MPVERVRANALLRSTAKKVALQRGPIVFCLEEEDNGTNLTSISLPRESLLQAEYKQDFLGGTVTIKGEAKKRLSCLKEPLYGFGVPSYEEAQILAIPYFAWANRKSGEMLVWIYEDET